MWHTRKIDYKMKEDGYQINILLFFKQNMLRRLHFEFIYTVEKDEPVYMSRSPTRNSSQLLTVSFVTLRHTGFYSPSFLRRSIKVDWTGLENGLEASELRIPVAWPVLFPAGGDPAAE